MTFLGSMMATASLRRRADLVDDVAQPMPS
jgi:hypothetical protein